MALPSSGPISFADMNTELGRSSSQQISLNDAGRYLAKAFSGVVSMSNLVGASALTPISNIIIAGGGGGGSNIGGGGGAGGAIIINKNLGVSGYNAVIGAAGGNGNSGNNSAFDGLTAIGGGSGGIRDVRGGLGGGAGGGGAGAHRAYVGLAECNAGGGTSGQGYNGGVGTSYNIISSGNPSNVSALPNSAGGGGGGRGGAGQGVVLGQTGTPGGAGGAGFTSTIRTGNTQAYAGGGGGGTRCRPRSTASAGGGLGGTRSVCATVGANNTGSGGGGGGAQPGARGGSGIVIVAYEGPQRYLGGTVCCHSGNCVSHTFTSSGCLVPRCI